MAGEGRIWLPVALFLIGLAVVTEAVILGALQSPHVAPAAELAIGAAVIAAGFVALERASQGLIQGVPASIALAQTEEPEIGAEPRILVIGPAPILLDAWRAGQSRRRRAGWIAVGAALFVASVAILLL